MRNRTKTRPIKLYSPTLDICGRTDVNLDGMRVPMGKEWKDS